MASISVEYRHYIGNPGELADADVAPVLSDPTGSWGAIRNDNSDVVVPANTQFTKQATGVYLVSWEDVAPGLTYRYYVKVTSGGFTYYNERQTSLTEPDYVFESRYSSYANLIRKYGKSAVVKWASIDGSVDSTYTSEAIRYALLAADSYIDTYLNGGPYIVPLTTVPIPLFIVEIATMLAGALLYEAQGIVDFDPEAEPNNRMNGEKRKAMIELGRIKSGRLRLIGDDGVDLSQAETTPDAGDSVYVPVRTLYATDYWIEE